MPDVLDNDPEEEMRLLQEWERRITSAAARGAAWTPRTSGVLSQWAYAAPHVDPQAALSLARAGVTPWSPAGRALVETATVDYQRGYRRGEEPSRPPRPARPRSRLPNLTKAPEDQGWFERNIGEPVAGAIRAVRDARSLIGKQEDVAREDIGGVVRDVRDFRNQTNAAIETVDPVVGRRADNPVADIVKPTFRTTFMALNAPLQEGEGTFRNIVGDIRREGWLGAMDPRDPENLIVPPSQSDAMIAVEHLLTGQDVDTGAGLFVDPESGVAQERYRRELTHGTIDGSVITPGRWFTDTFTGLDKGDTGFGLVSGLVDAGVTMGADPTNWIGAQTIRTLRAERQLTGGLGELAAAERAAGLTTPRTRMLEEVGALPSGIVPDLDRHTVAGWLVSKPGQRITTGIAERSDFYELDLATGQRLDPDLVLRLADESDSDAVRQMLFDEAGLSLGPQFRYTRPHLTAGTWGRRAFHDMPVDRISTDDPRGFIVGLESRLVSARVPAEEISPFMRQAAEARTRLDRVSVWERAEEHVGQHLAQRYGLDPEVARAVTRWVTEDHATQRRIFDSDFGSMTRPADGTLTVGDEPYYFRHAQLDSEMAPEFITVSSTREIRRLTSALHGMAPMLWDDAGKLNVGARFLEGLSTNVWKKITVLRPAWTVRQVGVDEQVRLAAVGAPSMWRHPMALIAASLDNKAGELLEQVGTGPNAVLRMSDEMQETMLRHIPFPDVQRRALDEWHPITRSDDAFVPAWGRELGQLHASDVARRLADTGSVDTVVDDLLNGDLRDLAASLAARPHGAITGEPALREWVTSIQNRLLRVTGGNDDLLDAVVDGYLRGESGPLYFQDVDSLKPTPGFEDVLAGHINAAPPIVKAELDTKVPQVTEMWDRGTNWAFGMLGAKPSNFLSRNPAWRHNYYEALIEKFHLLDPDAQARALDAARRSRLASGMRINALNRSVGVGGDLLARMEDAARSGVSGDVAWADANQYARVSAMERTQAVLGDLTTRGHLEDAVRVFMPFAPAWREMMQAYLRIIKSNPLIVYDISKGVEGSISSGFFHRDTNGEWVFNYPASGWLMGNLPGGPGVPFPLTGRAQGLTMGFEVQPGFGPMAQIPAQWILPNTPRWDGVREIVMPYGVESDPRHFLTPEWLERIGVYLSNQDPDTAQGRVARSFGWFFGGDQSASAAQFGSSVGDVMTYLASTGDYDLSTESGVAAMAEEARKRAAALWLWRGIAQFGAPSAPRPLATFFDESGDLSAIPAAAERYYQLLEEDPLRAGQRFLEEFGELAFLVTEPKSESNALYIPGDAAGYDWARNNAEVLERYPIIGGLFAPVGGGDAGIGAYLRAIEEGERTPVDPTERLYRSQDHLASILYNVARATALKAARRAGRESVTEEQQDALREYRRALMDRYRGYLRQQDGQPPLERIIGDLSSALEEEPVFAESEAGEALGQYLTWRQAALDRLQSASETADSLSADAAVGLRAALRDYGERLVVAYPSFANAWDRVLSREVEEPDL